MKLPNFTRPLRWVREHNTNIFFFFFSKLRYGPFGFNPRKFRQKWQTVSVNSRLSEFSVYCYPEILRLPNFVTKGNYSVRSYDILKELCWPTLRDKWKIQMNIMMYKVYDAAVPKCFTELFRLTSEVHNCNIRGSKFDMQLPKTKTDSLKENFCLSWGNCMEWTSESCQRLWDIKYVQSVLERLPW